MAVKIYMDVHVPKAITIGLRIRSVSVITAQEDERTTWSDADLLDRATEMGAVLFSFDTDFLMEGSKRQREGTPFSGIIYIHPLKANISRCIRDLELIAKASEPAELANRIEFLPL